MKPEPRAHCRHCSRPLWQEATKRGVAATNLFTRDHIIPRARRRQHVGGVRTTWPSCLACNQLRAVLHHCPAMLPIAADLAAAIGVTRKEAVRCFRLDGLRGFYTPPPKRIAA
jgi:hypothetical protein